ncbi:MAG: RNA polymerase sigma factor [Planctomycetia bacterium]
MYFSDNALFHFVAFVNGGKFGFEGFWREAKHGIRRTVRKNLRRKHVVDSRGRVDDNAVSEVENTVLERLLTKARRRGPPVFSPDKSHNSPAGLSRWMQKLVGNCVADYCRKFHGARSDIKSVSLDGLELNPVSPSSADGDEVVKDVFRRERIELVRECLDDLTVDDRLVLQRVYFEYKSHVEVAAELGVHKATAFRMIDDARTNLLRLVLAHRRQTSGRKPSVVTHRLAS